MIQFRIWPATAAIAMLATTAIALAGPTPSEIGTARPVSPVHRPLTVTRHPVATAARRPVTTPVAAAPRPVVARRVNPDVSDDALLARINRIDRESCAMVMRERADFAPAILAGIIEQRQAECMRMRGEPGFVAGRSRDVDDSRFNDRRVSPARFADVRDDRLIDRLRADDRRDDRRFNGSRIADRRDDRLVKRLRADDRRDDRRTGASRFATSGAFHAHRVASFHRGNRPMGRPRP